MQEKKNIYHVNEYKNMIKYKNNMQGIHKKMSIYMGPLMIRYGEQIDMIKQNKKNTIWIIVPFGSLIKTDIIGQKSG